MSDREQNIKKITEMATRIRAKSLKMAVGVGGNSHIGGGLSLVEIVATLYGGIMRFNSSNPHWPDRDRFILSKGHGVLGYYAALSEAGFIPEEDLKFFEKSEGYLFGHPIMKKERGIEFSNGSLGMGLGLGIGVALAGKRREAPYRVFVLMGDGECNEGSVWEGALAAAHFKLDNLVGMVDRNNLQQTGANKDIMSVGDIAAKWKSFGWEVTEVDGHHVGQLYDALSTLPTQSNPKMVVAHTVKGKGLVLAENNNDWHHAMLTREQYQKACVATQSNDCEDAA